MQASKIRQEVGGAGDWACSSPMAGSGGQGDLPEVGELVLRLQPLAKAREN